MTKTFQSFFSSFNPVFGTRSWQTQNPLQKEWSTTSLGFTWKHMVKQHHSSFTHFTGLKQTLGRFPELLLWKSKESWACWDKMTFLMLPQKEIQYLEKGGGDNMREQCIQAPCINPFFQPRFAEHTCLRLAVPYFAPRTFTEQLKSFISLCPDKPEFKRNLNKMKQLHDPTPKSVS